MPPRPRTDPSPWRGGVLPETGRYPGHGQSGANGLGNGPRLPPF